MSKLKKFFISKICLWCLISKTSCWRGMAPSPFPRFYIQLPHPVPTQSPPSPQDWPRQNLLSWAPKEKKHIAWMGNSLGIFLQFVCLISQKKIWFLKFVCLFSRIVSWFLKFVCLICYCTCSCNDILCVFRSFFRKWYFKWKVCFSCIYLRYSGYWGELLSVQMRLDNRIQVYYFWFHSSWLSFKSVLTIKLLVVILCKSRDMH